VSHNFRDYSRIVKEDVDIEIISLLPSALREKEARSYILNHKKELDIENLVKEKNNQKILYVFSYLSWEECLEGLKPKLFASDKISSTKDSEENIFGLTPFQKKELHISDICELKIVALGVLVDSAKHYPDKIADILSNALKVCGIEDNSVETNTNINESFVLLKTLFDHLCFQNPLLFSSDSAFHYIELLINKVLKMELLFTSFHEQQPSLTDSILHLLLYILPFRTEYGCEKIVYLLKKYHIHIKKVWIFVVGYLYIYL
jgi:hypothetical protein